MRVSDPIFRCAKAVTSRILQQHSYNSLHYLLGTAVTNARCITQLYTI